jgi:serine/threonine protein kinase
MNPHVSELLLRWEEQRGSENALTPEQMCGDDTESLEQLRAWIGRLDVCDWLLSTGPYESADEEFPEEIADFKIRRLLGRGGMGVVYEGWDPSLRRSVAVKVLRPSAAHRPFVRTEVLARRFDREGQVLALLKHEYIVPVYRAGIWDGRPFIAMEFVSGGPLSLRLLELRKQGPLAIAAFIEKVARAVNAAHEQGVLHRDLKPSNILVDDGGDPCVSDFGLAKFWTQEESAPAADATQVVRGADDLTFPGIQPGTPAYMAPEQFDIKLGPIGPATDVWALGIVLYELLTGRHPFQNDSTIHIADQICQGVAPSCRSIEPAVPRWLEGVVARCLAKSPAERFGSAKELAEVLNTGLRPRQRLKRLVFAVLVALIAVASSLWVSSLSKQLPLTSVAVQAPWEEPFESNPDVIAALRRLQERKVVILVDDQNLAPINKIFGPETVRIRKTDERLVEIQCRWTGPGTVEFLPSLPPGKYRVSLRVRHDEGGEFSRIALYVGGRHWKSERGEHLSCVALEFADLGPQAAVAPRIGQDTNAFASFKCLLTGEATSQRYHWQGHGSGDFPFLTAAAARKKPGFRTLVIDVLEAEFKSFWEDENQVGTLSFSEVESINQRIMKSFPAQTGQVIHDKSICTGGVGLIICNGTVSVDELRITPLE